MDGFVYDSTFLLLGCISLNRVNDPEEVALCVCSLVCDLRLPRFQMPRIPPDWLFALVHGVFQLTKILKKSNCINRRKPNAQCFQYGGVAESKFFVDEV